VIEVWVDSGCRVLFSFIHAMTHKGRVYSCWYGSDKFVRLFVRSLDRSVAGSNVFTKKQSSHASVDSSTTAHPKKR